MEATGVALIGLGTVGSGVAQILISHGDRIARRAGRALQLRRVIVQQVDKSRSLQLAEGLLSDRLDELIDDSSISIVAQLIGGLEPARTIMLAVLESGKDVVTANKALLAEHGPELFQRARELGRSIAFEAAVAGGVPVVTGIGQCLAANQIISIQGILNGTSNFIVTRMMSAGISYQDAVSEAQQRGYAEADPRLDVDGSDAAQKLALLSQLAFGTHLNWRQIPRTGIEQLDIQDLQYAEQMGYRVKLLATATLESAGLEMHVSPTLVRRGRPLAEVGNSNNAVSVVGDAVGRVFFHGQGAGQMPTSSAVVADLIDTATGRSLQTFQHLPLWSSDEQPISITPASAHRGRYYLRMMVVDEPGMMATVAQALSHHDVSINSIFQPESSLPENPQQVNLIIMTHATTGGSIKAAVEELEQSPATVSECILMRVLD